MGTATRSSDARKLRKRRAGRRQSRSMSSAPRLVQRLGLALVAAGLVAGAAVYVSASSDPDDDLVAQQREMREVARLGGTAAVQTVRFNLWFASLWHGQR